MYKTFSLSTAVACLLGLSLFSCQGSQNKELPADIFDTIRIEKGVNPLTEAGDSVVTTSYVHFLLPYVKSDVKKPWADSLNQFIASVAFGKELNDTSLVQFAQYQAEGIGTQTLAEAQAKEEGFFYTYLYVDQLEGSLLTATTQLLVYRFTRDYYTGGAHGYNYAKFINIDIEKGKVLSLNDLLIENYHKDLTDALKKQFEQDLEKDKAEGTYYDWWNVDGIAPSEDFYITSDGIVFYYAPYEIGPYAAGDREIKVPFTAIQHLLSDHPILRSLTKKD